MRTRKFTLILFFLFFLSMLVGCTNDAAYHSGIYLQPNTIQKETAPEKKNKDVNYSINTKQTQENVAMQKSTTNSNESAINDENSGIVTTKVISDVTTIAGNTETNEVIDVTSYLDTEEKTVTEVIVDEPVDPVVPATQPVEELTIQQQQNVPNDSIVIKDVVINLAYGEPSQEMVDNNDAVYDTGYITNIYNTLIFGYSYNGFSILDSMVVGEKFAMNNQGETKYFEVQKSGLAVLDERRKNVTYVGETEKIFYTNFGYHGLILFTCDKQEPQNHRWIVIAKEIIE